MKKILKYSLLAACVLALSAACSQKIDPVPEADGPEIRFAVDGSGFGTKGLLNAGGLAANGTQLHVYDILTGFSGTVGTQTSDGSTPLTYIDGTIQYDATTTGLTAAERWKFTTAPEYYRWTKTGMHTFFGWLVKDNTNNAGLTLSGLSYAQDTHTLTVPAITFSKDSPQFDLLYSNIVSRDATVASDRENPVDLDMKHIFSALAITLVNNSPDKAYIKSLTLTGISNTKSASVQFDLESNQVAVNYQAPSSSAFFPNWPSSVTTDATYGKVIPAATQSGGATVPVRMDLINGASLGENDPVNYMLMWPQTQDEFEAAKISVEYYIDGVKDPDDETKLLLKQKELYIKDAVGFKDVIHVLSAGFKYSLMLEFKDKTIDLTLVPIPWTMVYEDLDYSTSTILANSNKENDGVLWLYYLDENNYWQGGSRDRQITMQDNKSIQGRFYILAPHTGEWEVTTYPAEAAQYFVLEPSSGAIEDLVDIEGGFTGYVEFLIKPKPGLVLPSTQVLHFNVNIMLNGQWRNANTEFNRKDWQLTREP